MFKHIVMIKLKNREEAKPVEAMLIGLKQKISVLRSLEVGLDELYSPRSYDLVLTTSFDHKEDYFIYDQHADHQPVKEKIQAVSESVFTVDYTI